MSISIILLNLTSLEPGCLTKKYLKTTKNVFELTVLEDLSPSCQEGMLECIELEVYGGKAPYIMADHAAERSRRKGLQPSSAYPY